MFDKFVALFKGQKESEEQIYLREQGIEFDPERGYIVNGIVMNDFSERLAYFSNRKLTYFNDLKALYDKSMIVNEKIDLEIANQCFVARLGNTEENLRELKALIQKLNDYYRSFKRDKK